MAMEVIVGPPFITITRGNTFVISEPDGWIKASTDQGFYSRDTRYVSKFEIFVNRQRLLLQNSGVSSGSSPGRTRMFWSPTA